MDPLVVFEGRDPSPVDVRFWGIEEIDHVVEALDVEAGEYLCFDGFARPVSLEVTGSRTTASLTTEQADVDAVRARLRSWLGAASSAPTMPPGPADAGDTGDVNRWLRTVQDALDPRRPPRDNLSHRGRGPQAP